MCGLPLGATRRSCAPAAMANLLGDCGATASPTGRRRWRIPDVKLHLYGKSDAAPRPQD